MQEQCALGPTIIFEAGTTHPYYISPNPAPRARTRTLLQEDRARPTRRPCKVCCGPVRPRPAAGKLALKHVRGLTCYCKRRRSALSFCCLPPSASVDSRITPLPLRSSTRTRIGTARTIRGRPRSTMASSAAAPLRDRKISPLRFDGRPAAPGPRGRAATDPGDQGLHARGIQAARRRAGSAPSRDNETKPSAGGVPRSASGTHQLR